MDGLPEFYELHLILLSIVCLLSLLADRYSKKNRKLRDVVDERLGSSSLATLTRQYLVVYAIVMGSSTISLPLIVGFANTILKGLTGYRAHTCILYIENSTISRRGWLQFSSLLVSSLQDWQLLWLAYGRINSKLNN